MLRARSTFRIPSLVVSCLLLGACHCNSDGGGSLSVDSPTVVVAGTVAELGLVPFDADREDLVGPADHSAQYGMRPEIVAQPDGTSVDVLVTDHADPTKPRAFLLRLDAQSGDYVLSRAWEMPFLDRTIGFARDEAGDYYVATAVDEGDSISKTYPSNSAYRHGIVYVYKVGADGTKGFVVDLDVARHAFERDAEQIINPLVASSGRLAVAGGQVALVHGINTQPDSSGTRHQKALTTTLDSTTGSILATSSIWVSHSFDERLVPDGDGILEMHLGDAYPRSFPLTRIPDGDSYSLFRIKGNTGDNNTRSRLGGIAPISGGTVGYLALFATERTTGIDALDASLGKIAGSRELGLVRVMRDFTAHAPKDGVYLDPALPDTQSIESGGTPYTNHLRFLTDYTGTTSNVAHAERPKLVPLGSNRYLVLWERWENDGNTNPHVVYRGTWAEVIDDSGNVLVAAQKIGDHHLHRGDDAFPLGDGAAWISGDSMGQALYVNLVSGADLAYTRITVE